jgi:hypothetical protein
MIPETEHPGTLQRMISAGEARAPADVGIPDVIVELGPDVGSLAELLIADAIHLASADPFRPELTEFITYDLELAKAAAGLGFPAGAPP